MINKEENALRRYLDSEQMNIIIENGLLHLISMAMRAHKNESDIIESIKNSEQLICHCPGLESIKSNVDDKGNVWCKCGLKYLKK